MWCVEGKSAGRVQCCCGFGEELFAHAPRGLKGKSVVRVLGVISVDSVFQVFLAGSGRLVAGFYAYVDGFMAVEVLPDLGTYFGWEAEEGGA